MNIKEAKDQVKNAITAYFTKDEMGDYIVPIEKQRPIFLMGAPGIGKTAIMEQIASEMGVGLISYSMTHHTRQSALGLPFITHKTYLGTEFDISEYTMSEIIASVYDMMESTGIKEGILFLDEINCVSETLAPVMLQFLQYKIFGKHKVPKGWIIVTAGNPPEYNNSVREFDIVTWDRLKRVDVEPDFQVWKEYAYKKGVHPAVMTYLEIKKSDFYVVESTVDGKHFVTARGWDDLSQMIQLYEMHDIKVDENLIGQYLQKPQIAKDFAVYYDLFQKYKSDYQVDSILSGGVSDKIKNRARKAKFDERLSLIGMMLDMVTSDTKDAVLADSVMKDLLEVLKRFKSKVLEDKKGVMPAEELRVLINEKQRLLEYGKEAGSISQDTQQSMKKLIQILEEEYVMILQETDGQTAYDIVKDDFNNNRVSEFKKKVAYVGNRLSNMFVFSEEVFEKGQELLIIVTELTINSYASLFISKYKCEEYFKHNKDLLIYERQKGLEEEVKRLNLE